MKVLGLIPARYASTRFPGKPLHPIAGKPLIQHVVERCKPARSLSEVIVATDDERIREVVRKFCRVEMTRLDHPSGSDRIAEVAARCACDAVINIQGDEPLIDPNVIDAVAAALADNEMSTAATVIGEPAEYDNPNVVKVVVNAAGCALYFSRRTIPFLRDAASGSSFEAFGRLRLPARDVVAVGEMSGLAARGRRETGTVAGAGKRDCHCGRESELRQRGSRYARRCGAGGSAYENHE